MIGPETHFSDLQDITSELAGAYAGKYVVERIDHLMPRQDDVTVFDEGGQFSGMQSSHGAEACITLAASPHVAPSVPRDTFMDAASRITGKDSQIPSGMDAVDTLPAHAVVWWRDENSGQSVDLKAIAELPERRQEGFLEVIEDQTTTAIELISTVQGKPTIWGGWGFGRPEERMATGRRRGVVTNGDGHLHVEDLSMSMHGEPTAVELTPAEQLNHYSPWATLFHDRFSRPIGETISRAVQVDPTESVTVTPFTELISSSETGTLKTINNGYLVEFEEPARIGAVIKGVSQVVKSFDDLFSAGLLLHRDRYVQEHDDYAGQHGAQAFEDMTARMGFMPDETVELAQFIWGIRPTYAQLEGWIDERLAVSVEGDKALDVLMRKKKQYERVRPRISELAASNVVGALLHDTVADPTVSGSIIGPGVWPVRAAGAFVIDDYEVKDGQAHIHSVALLPNIDSTESPPEHITGRILRRPTGEDKKA